MKCKREEFVKAVPCVAGDGAVSVMQAPTCEPRMWFSRVCWMGGHHVHDSRVNLGAITIHSIFCGNSIIIIEKYATNRNVPQHSRMV